MWIDTHCHIHTESDPLALARDSLKAGVDAVICIGTDVASSQSAIGLAATIDSAIRAGTTDLPRCYSTVGLHPHDASNPGMTGVEGITHLARLNSAAPAGSLVAIGECGLDYFYENSPKQDQQLAFSQQIELAKELDLTLVIHTRDAWEDTFSILSETGLPSKVVFHCFTGDRQLASRALDLGAYLSFSGMVTFKNAENIREAVEITPLDRLLIETDSPYLAPVPHRGKTNVPANVGLVGEFIANLKKLSSGEFSYATEAAANECFSLK